MLKLKKYKPHALVIGAVLSFVIIGAVTNNGVIGGIVGLLAGTATQPFTLIASIICGLIPGYRKFIISCSSVAIVVAFAGLLISNSNRNSLGIALDSDYQFTLFVCYIVSTVFISHVVNAVRISAVKIERN